MRNRRKTVASLRSLAERPGTPEEGATARKLLERMVGSVPAPKLFSAAEFPRGTAVFYNYWAYPQNDPCIIVGKKPKIIQGQTWLRMKFAHLKQPRRVPVTSEKGCHIRAACTKGSAINMSVPARSRVGPACGLSRARGSRVGTCRECISRTQDKMISAKHG